MFKTSDFYKILQKRRSVRRYTNAIVPAEIIQNAIEAAIIAPNSSNVQTWDFYLVKSLDAKQKVAQLCLNQSAARTANQLLAVVADPVLWKRSQKKLIEYTNTIQAPQGVKSYYTKLIPIIYTWGLFNIFTPFKKIAVFVTGLFKPIVRGPSSRRDLQEVAIKSAALAAENFVLSIAAQGYATCMMEGFDEVRLKKFLKLGCSARIVMVIAIGEAAENGTWGPQYRLPIDEVFHVI